MIQVQISLNYKNNVSSLAFVTNIPYDATAQIIGEFFKSKFGEISDLLILNENYHGKRISRGIGFVEFKD